MRRLLARGHSRAEAAGRVAAQMPLARKMSRSDFVLYNDSNEVGMLERQVDMVLSRVLEK
jgi:dephospho-CoA kinase